MCLMERSAFRFFLTVMVFTGLLAHGQLLFLVKRGMEALKNLVLRNAVYSALRKPF